MDWRDLIPETAEGRMVWFGIVAAAAVDLSTLIPVIIPDFDENLQWGPCRWQARDAISLPAKGDECLVAIDNQHNPWIIAWWPF